MASGILGTWDISAGVIQAVYVNNYDGPSVTTINFTNRNAADVRMSIAISDSATAPSDAEWIEYNVLVGPNGVLLRTGVIVSTGKYILVQSNRGSVNCVVTGNTSGDQVETPITITQNTGTAPVWITPTSVSVDAGSVDQLTFQADPVEAGQSISSYSLVSGTLPPGTSLTSSGLLTGTVSISGYAATDPVTSAVIRATDSGGASANRTFNITRFFTDGSTQAKAAPSAQHIYDLSASFRGAGASGWYWIKGTGSSSEARRMYCSMNGAGYMMWYHYRDPMGGSLTITDPGTSGTTFNLLDTTAMFMYALPNAIADNVTYIYCNSSNDSNSTTPQFSEFKYALQIDNGMRDWMKREKSQAEYWGVRGTATNSINIFSGTHYRYGTQFNSIQYGHNHGGGNEVESLNFRPLDGSGSVTWTTSGNIWDYSGWGVIDASSPTNINSGWGSTGRDEGTWSGSNRQDHVYCWCK